MSGRRNRNDDFVRGVLNRTSGSPCGRATGLLADLADGRLGDLDRQLVQAHLEHCPGCLAVAVTLGWVDQALPAMADLDPGPAFTAAVVARTSGAGTAVERAVRRGQSVGAAGLMDRLGRWWQQKILEPRFPLQAAYVATVVLVLLTALPVSPFRGAPQKALQVVQAGPEMLPGTRPVEQLLRGGADRLLSPLQNGVARRWRLVETDLEQRVRRSAPHRGEVGSHLRGAADRAGDGELGRAGYELLQTGRSLRAVWSAWWQDEQTENKNQTHLNP